MSKARIRTFPRPGSQPESLPATWERNPDPFSRPDLSPFDGPMPHGGWQNQACPRCGAAVCECES